MRTFVKHLLLLILVGALAACKSTENYPVACEEGVQHNTECSDEEFSVETDRMGVGGIVGAVAGGVAVIGLAVEAIKAKSGDDEKQKFSKDDNADVQITKLEPESPDAVGFDPTGIDANPPSLRVFMNSLGTVGASPHMVVDIIANDADFVDGYIVSRDATEPNLFDSRWKPIAAATQAVITEPLTFNHDLAGGTQTKTAYIWIKDSLGNISEVEKKSVNVNTTDQTPPEVSIRIATEYEETEESDIVIQMTASDEGGKVAAYLASEGSSANFSIQDPRWVLIPAGETVSINIPYTLEQRGSQVVFVQVMDQAGNISEADDAIVVFESVDVTAPQATSVVLQNGNPTTEAANVSMALVASDDVGVTAYYASEIDDVTGAGDPRWVKIASSDSYSDIVRFNLRPGRIGEPQEKTVYVRFKDGAGNISDAISTNITFTLKESGAPVINNMVINEDEAETLTSAVTIQLQASDATAIDAYYLSEMPWTPSENTAGWVQTNSSETVFNVSVNYTLAAYSGKHTIYAWVRDPLGNVSSPSTDRITVKPDEVSPTQPNITVNGGASTVANSDVTITLFSSDNSGIISYYLSEDETPPVPLDDRWQNVSSTTFFNQDIPFSLSQSNGEKTIYAWVKDIANNVSDAGSVTITFFPE